MNTWKFTKQCQTLRNPVFFERRRHHPASSGGRPGWVKVAQDKIRGAMGKDLHPETVKDIWRSMVDVCARIALRKNLL
jgi:hypothetical protein